MANTIIFIMCVFFKKIKVIVTIEYFLKKCKIPTIIE